jgi:YesN/AraC family two-component response regulator
MEKYRVLIIEDDKIAREQLARLIAKEDFDASVAEDGRAGISLFERDPFDIVITDLKMPGIDGMEVVHTVKHLSPDTEVVITTAYGETENAITALREGVLDYLKKPINLDDLILALGRARERIERRKKLPYFPTLLLAEDEAGTRQRLARVLEKEHWRVMQAPDGVEALELFKQKKIDVVLLDINMPRMDGLTALQAMRRETDDFTAIVLTGYGDETAAIQAMRAGACNFLKKPIDLDQMIVAVDKAIERVQIERALKYRTRDLALAEQILAKITATREIIIDFGGGKDKNARDFGRSLLDALPLGICVVDHTRRIRLVNQLFVQLVKNAPESMDEKVVEALRANAGMTGLSLDGLQTICNDILLRDPGELRTIETGRYSFVTCASISLMEDGKKEKVVLLAVRGERAG